MTPWNLFGGGLEVDGEGLVRGLLLGWFRSLCGFVIVVGRVMFFPILL